VLKCEELRWFLGLFLGATVLITLSILPEYDNNFFSALQHSAFQVASIMSTTGYATADFNLWPIAARMIILALLFTGACAGSTAGGMKICRIGMMFKQGIREVRRTIQPRKVQLVRFEGKAIEDDTLHQVAVFMFMYVLFIVLGGVLLSLEGRFDMQTNFTAALTCVSNVGPGLGEVGPAGGFAGYGPFAKLLSSFLMLAGRLEIFPMLALFHPAMWLK
jgi:trk system potassium uptake protein TrkH